MRRKPPAAKAPTQPRKRTPRPSTPPALAAPSPLNGVQLPVGAHPGATGGKPGRSGRKPDAFKRALEEIRDERGLRVLRAVLDGELDYTLNAKCEHCGKRSTGPRTFGTLLKLIPSADVRLRASEMTMRYTVGLEKTIRLEGPQRIAEAFETIKTRIRARLEADPAEALIVDIQHALRSL